MAERLLFSERMKRARGDPTDPYTYDALPERLRGQIRILIRRELTPAVGRPDPWEGLHRTLLWRRGLDVLPRERPPGSPIAALLDYFVGEADAERGLDVVELIFSAAAEGRFQGVTRPLPDILDTLNECFRDNGVGYQFESGQIVRVDSQFVHAEVVKPTLDLLCGPGLDGPNEEFLRAHEHHRHGRQKECVAECLKAFESTLKVICVRRGWAHEKNATAKVLIDTVLKHGLVPAYRENDLAGFRNTLDALPTLRNKTSGHGQGGQVTEVPVYLAAYALHLAATNILLLLDAEKALPK